MKNTSAMSLFSFPTSSSLLAITVVAVLGIVNARSVITVDAAAAAALNEGVSTSTSSSSPPPPHHRQNHGLRGSGRMMTSREPIGPTVHGRDRLGVSSGSSSSSSGPIGVGDGNHDDNNNNNNTDEQQQQQQQHQQQDDGGCTRELLTSNARTSVEDQYFTYSGPGQLDFSDETSFIGDILQLAVFAAYRDEIHCAGDGSSLQLDSSFFMFGYDMVTSATTTTTATAASDNGSSLNSNAGQGVDIVEQPQSQLQPVFKHSFFLMTFNMACNTCEIIEDGCGIPAFTDDENIVDASSTIGEIETLQVVTTTTTTTETETGCFCRPPSRQAFLRNLNERLQQNPNGLFDGIIVDSVAPIMVTPEPASSLSPGMVSRSSPGLGEELPIVLSTVPSHCQQQQQQQQKSQGIDITDISVDECISGRQVIKIVHNFPTLLCLES